MLPILTVKNFGAMVGNANDEPDEAAVPTQYGFGCRWRSYLVDI